MAVNRSSKNANKSKNRSSGHGGGRRGRFKYKYKPWHCRVPILALLVVIYIARVVHKSANSIATTTNDALHQVNPPNHRHHGQHLLVNQFGTAYPPLDSLLATTRNTTVITGNVSFLVDFVIAGFSKCGTSAIHAWLRQLNRHANNPVKIILPNEERFDLIRQQPHLLVQRMHHLYQHHAIPQNNTYTKYLQGYKQPKDVTFPQTLQAWQQHWPHAKLIITVRHPVLWFQSFVNFFKIDLRREVNVNDADTVGRKVPLGIWKAGIHTGLGEFHLYLSRLGKTNQTTTPLEWALLQPFYWTNETSVYAPAPYTQHQIFLLETAQLGDANSTRTQQLSRNLYQFLVGNYNTTSTPTTTWWSPPVIRQVRPKHNARISPQQRKDRAVNICHSQHDNLRAELLRIARAASIWIRTYFLNSPDVVVSNRAFLQECLQQWMLDPCDHQIIVLDLSSTTRNATSSIGRSHG